MDKIRKKVYENFCMYGTIVMESYRDNQLEMASTYYRYYRKILQIIESTWKERRKEREFEKQINKITEEHLQ